LEQEKIAVDKENADVKGKEVGEEKAIADSEKVKVGKKAEEIDKEVKDAEKKLASAFDIIRKIEIKDIKELMGYKSPSPKMMPLLGMFLEVWNTKEESETGKKLVYEMEEIEENGKKKKQKSFYKTSQRVNNSVGNLVKEMLDFPKEKLKNFPDIMFRLETEFKEIDRDAMKGISTALLAI
jgi:hypothetical protein